MREWEKISIPRRKCKGKPARQRQIKKALRKLAQRLRNG